MNCPFCSMVSGDIKVNIIWQDDDFLVFPTIEPLNSGHILLIPKKHYDSVYDIPESLYQKLFTLARMMSGSLKQATKVKRIGMVIEGFGVAHAHLHLVPINNPNELDSHRAKRASAEQLAQTEKLLVPFFKDIHA